MDGTMWMCGALLMMLAVTSKGDHPIGFQPEQMHLSSTGNPRSIMVTWVTTNKTDSIVEYSRFGSKLFGLKAIGSSTIFTDGGVEKRFMYIHRVLIKELDPGAQYVYHSGSTDGWSDMFFFSAMREGSDWSPQLAVFGDMGNENPQSLARLQKETQMGMYDAILHVGDFAYDMDEDNARIGDEFMRQIESIAAYVPYMTCPGNHENAYNFSNYRNRFSMPGNTEGLWYSWNIGPAHIISISTEVYYYTDYGLDLLLKQYEWLKKDLEEASLPENKKQTPWIITIGHRPMYCSNNDTDDCKTFNSRVRTGFNSSSGVMPGLEKLFFIYGVDIEFWAHEHSYERLWPIYDYKVLNGSRDFPYVNPKGPVHIITGSAGCRERVDPFVPHARDWSAFRSSDYGYTRLKIQNGSHVYLEQVSDDQSGKVIDSMWLIKENHGVAAWV
ncbi:unnamed protein product [Lampetra planeri]